MSRKYAVLDAEQSVFFSRQLEHVKTKTYDKVYPELKARTLFPVSFDTPSGASTVTYQAFSLVGMAKVIANYSTDIPRVDLAGDEFTAKVKSLGAGYGYSLQDIRAAQLAGMPLESRKSAAAKRAILQKEDDIAALGEASHGLNGILSHPNIPDVAIAADGTGSSSLWINKDADKILRDINALLSQVVTTTKGSEIPDTLVLSTKAFLRASSLRVGDTGKTVLAFLLETNPYIKKVEQWAKLDLAGDGGTTDVMFVYKRDIDKLALEVPQDFEQMPVQEVGLEFIVNCHSRTAGLIIFYPLSIAKADGI